MYQSRQRIQDVILLLADMLCFIISYFAGGYFWLVGYRNVSIENMKVKSFSTVFGIVLVIYMLVMIFSDIERNFIRRNLYRDFWAAIKASVVIIFVTSLTIFLLHNNADASRGVYFCIAGVNLILFFIAHAGIKYYLLKVYRNKRATNQVLLVTTADRVESIIKEAGSHPTGYTVWRSIAVIDDNQVGNGMRECRLWQPTVICTNMQRSRSWTRCSSMCPMIREPRLRRWSIRLRIWGQPSMSV